MPGAVQHVGEVLSASTDNGALRWGHVTSPRVRIVQE
jgi:hypothetical protein